MTKGSGKLIIFEGTDGAGKSTQIKLVAHILKERGYEVVSTYEPTHGPYGTKIRSLYHNRRAASPKEELELFLADRKEHVTELIAPALQRGAIVLCDRYYLSNAAYQGAIGCDVQNILEQNSFAPCPDLALLLSLPVTLGRQRISQNRGEEPNEFEKEEMLEKVATIFNSFSMPYIHKVDASQSKEQVHQQIMYAIENIL